MESYGEFAGVYDRLMDDFDYPAWADYYLELLAQAGVKPKKICDCACGTGSMTVEFAKRGLQVTGADLSRDMLEVASVKARKNACKILFSAQNMCDLALPRPVDAIVCACDGVNYLTTDEELSAFFRAARAGLKDGGCLAFDVSTRYKLETVIGDGFFGEDRDDVAYLWSNRFDTERLLADMDLTFFIKCDDGRYRRFQEHHRQRAYSAEELAATLTDCGFTDIRVYGDRTADEPKPREKRIHITAKRLEK